ncbi:MAG: zonular occludens toxin [Inoviridae sp.]|nr:MAG: zonular occludens toxin [Inoviridae sp.]
MSSNSNISLYILLALVALGIFIFFKISKYFKVPKIACVSLTTGGVKSGKSTFSVHLAISTYKRIHRQWKVRKIFQTLFNKPISEEPLLYSNIPLAVPYVPITLELLERKIRPRYGSVAYVNEASLLCDQMLYKDEDLNERLTLFNKLFGHETCGGYLVYDTQCIGDVHYAVKRSLSNYFYIHHLEKRIPFFLVAKVREERYSDDKGTVTNTYGEDVEENLKTVLIPRSVWKKFDAYCFSVLTDDLPVSADVRDTTDLKAREIVSFREFKTIINKEKGV